MANQEYKCFTFPNIGFVETQLTEKQLAPVKLEISKIQADFEAHASTKNNASLAGNIEREFALVDCKPYLQHLLLPLVKQFDYEFDYLKDFNHLTSDKSIVLDKTWVNFQQRTEFNPWHDHTGIMSFVLWIHIPYSIEQEKTLAPGSQSNSPAAGTFAFSYVSSIGQVDQFYIPVDKSKEGTLILFPAKIMHMVYPFYTADGYRTSVSGNFKFDI